MPTKILFTADWHVADRRQHNLEDDPLFRLHQFERLGDRFVSYCKSEGITQMYVLGDLVDKAVLQAHEARALRSLLMKITDSGVKVGYIIGNHDANTKSDVDDIGDYSLVPLIADIDGVEYVHHKVVEIEGVSIAFMNWVPDATQVDWTGKKVDILCGHHNILPEPFGAPLDTSNFDLGLFGDIHNRIDRDNCFAVGCPVQSNAGDDPDGFFTVLTVDGGKYSHERVNTIVPGEYDFLRVFRSDKLPKDYTPLKYDVIREVEKSDEVAKLDDDQLESLFDSEEALTEALKEEDDSVAKLIADTISHVETESLDLDTLKFDRMTIDNFRSIEHFELDFTDLDRLNRITGRVGAGKSSILRALQFVLVNSGSPKALQRIGGDPMSVSLTFFYRGFEHTIVRDGQYLSSWEIDGVKQESGSKRDLNDRFKSEHPWLDAWPLLYHDQFSTGFLMTMNANARVKFLSKLLGFDSILETHEALKVQLKNAKKELTQLRENVIEAEAVRAQTERSLVGSPSEDKLKASIKKSDETLESLRQKTRDARSRYDEAVEALSLLGRIESARKSVEAAKEKLSTLTDPGELPDITEDSQLIKDWEALPTQSDLDTITKKGKALKEELANPPDTCKECGGPLEVSPEWISAREEKIAELKSEYKEVQAKVKERESQSTLIDEARERIANYSTLAEQQKQYFAQQTQVDNAEASLENLLQKAPEQSASDLEKVKEKSRTEQDDLIEQGQALKEEVTKMKEILKDYELLEQQREAEATAEKVAKAKVEEVGIIETAVASTSLDGPVLSKTLAVAADVLSDGLININTVKKSGKRVVPDFDVTLNVDGIGAVPYDSLSGGQLNTVDSYLVMRLAKLVGGVPLVVFDESLKFADDETILSILDELKTSDIRNVILIAHGRETPQVTNIIDVQ